LENAKLPIYELRGAVKTIPAGACKMLIFDVLVTSDLALKCKKKCFFEIFSPSNFFSVLIK